MVTMCPDAPMCVVASWAVPPFTLQSEDGLVKSSIAQGNQGFSAPRVPPAPCNSPSGEESVCLLGILTPPATPACLPW